MDNLTHSLVGAALGYAGLRQRSAWAMPAVIIGANLPDIDASCFLFGVPSLEFRRGITHGPPALVLLPLLLTVVMVVLHRRRSSAGEGAQVALRPGWLFVAAFTGCLSHPALDLLNSYGIRLLEPFSSRWFYGDALFIIDGVLWLGLGFAVWLARRRERQRAGGSQRPARIALLGAALYIAGNLGLSTAAVRAVEVGPATIVVANPVPLAFWRRYMLIGQPNAWSLRRWTPLRGLGSASPIGRGRPCRWPGAEALRKAGPDVRAFAFWSRLPFVEAEPQGTLRLRDARFADRALRGGISVSTALPCLPP